MKVSFLLVFYGLHVCGRVWVCSMGRMRVFVFVEGAFACFSLL